MDRNRRNEGAIAFELYRHDASAELEPIRKYCKFHRLQVADLPREALLVEIQMSSLGTVGWAFTGVEDWDTIGDEHVCLSRTGGCVAFNEPNTLTRTAAPQTTPNTKTTTNTTQLRETCRERVRHKLLEHVDDELVEVLKVLGTFDEVLDETVAIITSKDSTGENSVLPVAEWIDQVIEVTLDSGACDHILDMADAPGYANFLVESPGSRRDQQYIVGNGAEVPNEGQVTLNLEASGNGKGGGGNLIKSIFQVAEITRPLMSVSRVCELGHKCVFDDEKAEVIAKDGTVLCTFRRKGGLDVAEMKLKAPEGFQRPAR